MTAPAGAPSDDWQTACGLASLDAPRLVRRANAAFCQWSCVLESDLVGGRTFSDLLAVGGRIFYQTHVPPLPRIQGSVAELGVRTLGARVSPMLVPLRTREDGRWP